MPNSSDVLFKFCQPSGAPARRPSESMTAALRNLSEAHELRSLVAETHARGRKVVAQVYHSADGRLPTVSQGLRTE
jgi:hypothetical protein